MHVRRYLVNVKAFDKMKLTSSDTTFRKTAVFFRGTSRISRTLIGRTLGENPVPEAIDLEIVGSLGKVDIKAEKARMLRIADSLSSVKYSCIDYPMGNDIWTLHKYEGVYYGLAILHTNLEGVSESDFNRTAKSTFVARELEPHEYTLADLVFEAPSLERHRRDWLK